MSEYAADPEKYREMSEPYETAETASESLSAFLDDVRALREKHRIAEIVVGAAVYFKDEDRLLISTNWCQQGDAIRGFFVLERIRPELAITAARAAALCDVGKPGKKKDVEND